MFSENILIVNIFCELIIFKPNLHTFTDNKISQDWISIAWIAEENPGIRPMDVCASFLSKGVIHLLLTIVLFYRFTAWRLLNRSISRAIDEEDEDWLFDFRNSGDWNIRSNLLVRGALVQNYSHFHFIALVLLIKFTNIPKIFFPHFTVRNIWLRRPRPLIL